MNIKLSDLDRFLANPGKLRMELEKRLEAAWCGELQEGYLHSMDCPAVVRKKMCSYDCNPSGFEEAKEVSAWLGLVPKRV